MENEKTEIETEFLKQGSSDADSEVSTIIHSVCVCVCVSENHLTTYLTKQDYVHNGSLSRTSFIKYFTFRILVTHLATILLKSIFFIFFIRLPL